MACQWRIRHKLVIGLGLVVAIVALLLVGTLNGLMSYYASMKNIQSKVAELRAAEALKAKVADLAGQDATAVTDEKIQEGRKALEAYADRLQETLSRGRDPGNGFQELGLIDALGNDFNELTRVTRLPIQTSMVPQVGTGASLEPAKGKIREAVLKLQRDSGDLRDEIYRELGDRISESRRPYQVSMWIVLSTSIVGVLMMAGLLRFFYGWVFNPIRELELGAGRVAQGDFEHRIEVHSGDEMEELAAAFNDMTSRLREMYRDLARQVNERSRQLVRSERLASVGFLAAGVAHEINNPLASIAFCSEALESRLAGLLARSPKENEVITKYLNMIQEEAFRCKAITQRLLEFSRSGEKHREQTNMADLIQSVLDVVQHLQNCKGKTIQFEPATRVVAWVNAQEVKSVILNLVVNALDCMDDGGTLTIRLRQREGMAEMVFADNGCGMSDEVLENIFEPFFTRSRTGKGTGLGLTISHRVISQHGGEIEAASPGVNQGSTFTVRLPLQSAESVKEEPLGNVAA